MVNLGPLAAEIVSLVWSTPGNFNGFRILAALLHGTLVVGVSQTAALNRGRHRYSAGRPSRWALTHISSCVRFSFFSTTPRDWTRRTSSKLPVLCRVRRRTLTHSVNQSTSSNSKGTECRAPYRSVGSMLFSLS